MTTTHSTITDPEIHEPKGAAEAAANTVYRADGAGSGNWEAPLKLIERRALSGNTTEEFTGLSSYRYLVLVVEGVTLGATGFLMMQFSTASTYRTTGYTNALVGGASNATNNFTTGIHIGYCTPCGFSVVEISNFNAAAPTSVTGQCVSESVNRISTTSTGTAGVMGTFEIMGFYRTAEAHEKIKIYSSTGATLSSGYFTLYGIR